MNPLDNVEYSRLKEVIKLHGLETQLENLMKDYKSSAVDEVDKWISPGDKKITMQDFEDAIYDEHITKPFAENWRKLGEYLKNEQKEGKREFRIAFQNDNEFIIHPLGEHGDTMDMTLSLPSAPKQEKEECNCVLRYEFCLGDTCYFKNEQDKQK